MAMQQRQEQEERLRSLLSLHAQPKPLAPHELASDPHGRREGLRSTQLGATAAAARRWTEDMTSLALDGCPFDEYLGLRWYRRDPLPWIRRACRTANDVNNASNASSSERLLFVDHEFPVHESVRLTVSPGPGEKEVECVPGIVTSSNCRDFRTDRHRIPRIKHFVQKAQCGKSRKSGWPRWTWVRGSSMQNCSLFSCPQSVDPRNVVQGKVGNCGFCSGFSSLAAGWPDVLVNAFGNESTIALSECGAVRILLFPLGEPRYLLMDDYVLCGANDRRDNNGGAGGTTSPSMHSLLCNDLWVRLLEKAFVKIQGSYASLDGHYKYNSLYRHPARALQLLTGAPVALEVHYSKADADVVYTILAKATQGKCARVVHCRKRVDGLHSNHGYSLLWAGEGAGGTRLACLRNPHGRGSYTGKFGFGRPAEELRRAVCGKGEDGTLPECLAACPKTGRIIWRPRGDGRRPTFSLWEDDQDDGVFFMEFGKFVECFPKATLVGPVRSRTADASPGADDGAAFGHQSNVPDCVHVMKGENLARVIDIFETASGS